MIKIMVVGKVKEKYLNDAIKEYTKRLSKYTKIDIIEVEDDNGDDVRKILSSEKEGILKNIKEKDYVIVLDIDGIIYNSVELATKIDKLLSSGYSDLTFIIGGSYGLHEEIKGRANLRLSFSKLTFPHQLFRVMLLEQLYRSFKINNNETYHK